VPLIRRCDLVPQYEALRSEIHVALERVLRSGRYILAEEVAAFEREFAAYLKVPHVIGVADGTAALTFGLQAVGVEPGDEVITTCYTAFPTIGAIVRCGARPVLVDVCRDSFLIDVDQVAAAITPRTRAVVPVHLFGNIVDLPRLRAVIGDGIAIVEDAAQAHGSRLGDSQAGSIGDVGCFSFYPTKNLGGYGDGGAVVVHDAERADQLRLLRNHGMPDKDRVELCGINSRLDELHARRTHIAGRYRAALVGDRYVHQAITPGSVSNYHVFELRYLGDRDGLVRYLADHDIQTNVYYEIPHHLQPALRDLGYQPGSLPRAEQLSGEVIALPMYPELGDAEVERVIDTVLAFQE
jgi:dTDP-4-amino-4,6-dideoxygalactose transaminase